MVEPPTDAVEAMRRFIAEQNGYDDPDMQGTAEDAVAVVYPLIAARVRAEAAETVAAMCHWVQDIGAVRARESHEAFHFGYSCPYEAAAVMLRGEPDPRRATVSDSGFLARVRAEAVADERQRFLEELHEQAQLLPVEQAQMVSTWLARAAGSVPVATPTTEWAHVVAMPGQLTDKSLLEALGLTAAEQAEARGRLRAELDHIDRAERGSPAGPVATPTEPPYVDLLAVLHEDDCEHGNMPEVCARCDGDSPVPAVQPPAADLSANGTFGACYELCEPDEPCWMAGGCVAPDHPSRSVPTGQEASE